MKQFFASVYVRMTVLMLFSLSIQQIAQAQVRVPFKQRTSAFSPTKTIYSINGDYTMIGNTNLTLQNYSDTRLNSNNTMIKVDADGISGTNNSSASTLTFSTENGAVPSCSKVLYAGLYWTARTDNNATEIAKRTVKFRGPNQDSYTTYTALSNEIRYPGDDNMYVAFTEVTSQVQQCGLGQYWLADMALTTGDGGNTGYYGGWGMVVVYENSKMVKRDITVFDGYAYVIGGAAQWELPVSGFNSTLSGNVNMKLGMIAGEGDVTIAGDKFEIQKLNTSSWQLLNHASNSSDNFFNSSIFTGGNARNPSLKNNTGVDISMFSIPNANNQTIGNGQSSTKFRYSSTQDTYIIYSICMAVDAYEPGVEGFLTTESVNQVPVTGSSITVLPGDQVQYKVQIKNTGNEAINNAQLKIPLPYAAIKYVGSTVQVFSPATSTSQPFVDLGMGANGTLVWNIGSLPKPANPNTVLGEIVFTLKVSEDCDLYKNFKCAAPSVDIDGTISGTGVNTGISVNDQPFYVGFSNTDGCTTEPLTGPFKINIDATAWTNTNCQNQSEIRDFAFCNRTTPIQVTEVLGFYPVGTRFFNTAQTIEYTTSNPLPSVAGPTTYYAQLPNSSCVLSFRIAVNTISSVPTVMSGTSEFCQNGTSTILQATPSNPSYSLYYYAPGNPAIQPFILPATEVAGDFVYQVAEGPSSTCISINRANLPVKILPQPSITATANQIACFGATGSVSLSSSGGTGTLTYSSSNPSLSNLNAGSYTYEVSDSKGCKNTASALINPAPAQPQQPVIACWQSATWNTTTCSWDITGTQPTEPTNLACWQSANFNTSTCEWVVSGTQPAEPTGLSCWQSANFNTSTCEWVVSGTQPAEPTNLACWQSANFNTSTCEWIVTGTQPSEPTDLACWQSANFNTSTCEWVVSGTQPAEPTNLACWQSANFNTSTCEWIVSGTQPAEPTNLACWQSANFNTSTCEWVVSGTQPAEPTNLACWQSANFNTSTCEWVVSGTQPTEPTDLACWQSANFNTANCEWVVSGTQPTEPTGLSCWQSANFNTSTCEWVVSGTQPAEPSAQNCWDNYQFSTSSCSWVNTGSPAPLQTTTASACGSYLWTVNNQTYTSSGTFDFSENCQDYSLNLSITPIQSDIVRVSACDSYTWNGTAYTQSGTYTTNGNCENTCSQVEVSPYNCANTSGYTSTISTNTSDVNVGPGQVVRITAASFTRNLNISGGTLVICGSASPQNINMNTNGNTFLMVINGSVVLNNLNLPSKASIANYGSLTLNNSVGFSGTIKNYGSLTCQADFNVNSGGAFYNYATAMLLNHNNSNISENRGTLQIGNRLQNNGGSSLLNTCTMNVGNEFINNAFARNEGNLEIQQMLRINGGSILEIAAGKVVKTKNLNLDGTVRGTGSGLSRLAVSGSSLINSSGKLEGTSSLCDANGVETNNGQVISPALISCTGSPSSNSCCSSSTLILTITPSISNTTQVNACQSYTWSVNNTTYTNSGTYTSVNACETSILQLTISNPPQPPAVNCWDNFVFNSESCSWVNTGTQPSAPTNLACWQSANFNTSTCEWVVTGSNPAAITSVTGLSPLCVGGNANYSANGVVLGGGSGVWSSSNSTVASVNTATGAVSALSEGTTNIIYTITAPCGTGSGRTWETRNSSSNLNWQSVAYNGSTFVAVGRPSTGITDAVMTSTDGDNWTSVPHGLGPRNFNDVIYANNMFVAVSSDVQTSGGTRGAAMYSANGNTWTLATAPRGDWQSVAYGNGTFVAVASFTTTTKVMTSTDGINWTSRTPSSTSNIWRGVTFGNGLFVAVSTSGTANIMTSPNGINWTAVTPPGNAAAWAVAFGNEKFVAVSQSGAVMTSTDGSSWTLQTSAASIAWNDVTFADGLFVAVASSGTGNRIMTSADGISWVSEASAADNIWNGITYGNGKFVVVGETGTGNRVMVSAAATGTITVSAQQTLTVNPVPAEPTNLACWQSANFNTSTCEWVVSGTQPSAPTNLSCWQSANFNTSTCEWVVTGTQPSQPGTPVSLASPFNISSLPGYGVATSALFNFNAAGGWAGWSVPAGKVVLGAKIISAGDNFSDFAVFRPASPGQVFPHYTYGANEYGWVMQARSSQSNNGVQIEVYYADPLTNYTITESNQLNYNGAGGYGGWSAPAGDIVSGGGYQFNNTYSSAAISALAVAGSSWPHIPNGVSEQGWVVRGPSNNLQNPGRVYVISFDAPSTQNCWDNFVFNSESCSWVNTGTQPSAPTNLACWQSANFNTSTCEWVVSGTQPAEPTNLACWQSANFNTSTCEWVVSGTQPAEPTNLACWQTAAFNTETCEWVVTGTQNPVLISTISKCDNYTWPVNGLNYSISGNYPITIDCQDYLLKLTITNSTTNTNTVSACDAYTWNVNGLTYSNSGTYTATNDCNTEVLKLTINRSSQAPTGIQASATQTNGSTPVTLTVQGGSLGTNAVWKWYTGSCGGTLIGTGTSISVTPGSNTTYFVRADGSCNTTSCASVTINVAIACGPTTVSSNAIGNAVCKGRSVTLSVGGNTGTAGAWKWYRGTCGISSSCGSALATGATLKVTPTVTTTYFVRSEGGSCGTTTCKSITITVNSAPAAPGAISGQATGVCQGTNVGYSVVAVAGLSYTWTVPTGASIVGNTGNSIVVNFGNSLNSTSCASTITVRASNSCGTSAATSLSINGRPNKPSAINGPSSLCKNQVSTYSVTAVAGTNVVYNWTVPSGWTILSHNGNSLSVKAGTRAGIIGVTASNACGNQGALCRSISIGNCTARMAVDNEGDDERILDQKPKLYPNPASQMATLNFNAVKESAYSLRVINSLGQSVYSSEGNAIEGANAIELNLENLSNGLYIVQLVQDGSMQQVNLVKK